MAGYVEGSMSLAVDDPVAFASSVEAEAALQEVLADLGGSGVAPETVTVSMTAATSDLFASGGSDRRLLGLINVEFKITVPIKALDATISSLIRGNYQLAHVSAELSRKIRAKGRLDLTSKGGVFFQSISAIEARSTTTTSALSGAKGCPKSQLCFSQSCGSCQYWNAQEGLTCQKNLGSGGCVCSCFRLKANRTTPGPPLGLTSAATRTRWFAIGLAVSVLASVAGHLSDWGFARW